MRQLAPKVLTPEIPVDVAQWANLLNTMDALASFTITQEDLRKTEQYRSVSAFAGEKRQAVDENTFLTSLALHPTALPVTSASLARAAQLCAKTNQYNLRTIRHNEAELAALRNDPSAILFLTHLSDRFGDHGLVALTAACLTSDPAVAFLDSFMLSCRVLGRHLESWILSQLIAPLENKGARWLVAEYRPTPANVVAKDFLKEHGFTPLSMLSIAERDQVLSACRACLAEGSDVYAADLSTLVLPYLEPFRHDPSEPHAA